MVKICRLDLHLVETHTVNQNIYVSCLLQYNLYVDLKYHKLFDIFVHSCLLISHS